jgi:2-hydroxychromene-2-carboxylate isomerase
MVVPGVAFHFDVMCPWAYQTSVWIREARPQRDLDISWRFFSLEEVNREEGKLHPWERPWSYEAAGRALHVDGRPVQRREVLAAVMAEAGLDPADIGRALADETTHDDIRADHQAVLDAGGFGVPTMFLDDGTCLYGPVVTPAPTGAAAGLLWDLTVGWAEFPHLYELRRPKTATDWDHIGTQFAPYLAAREWRSVAHPVA